MAVKITIKVAKEEIRKTLKCLTTFPPTVKSSVMLLCYKGRITNEFYSSVLSCGTVYDAVQGGPNI